MRLQLLVVSLLLTACGCGEKPYQVAPVSGKVSLNGKPLAKAWVHFAPMASKGKHDPGPTSHGETDAAGRYKLIIDPEHPGAVVGRSRVFISSRGVATGAGADLPDANVKVVKEKVPARYNQATELIFEVPPGGTDVADFDLKAP